MNDMTCNEESHVFTVARGDVDQNRGMSERWCECGESWMRGSFHPSSSMSFTEASMLGTAAIAAGLKLHAPHAGLSSGPPSDGGES